jgi:hypothetical protein
LFEAKNGGTLSLVAKNIWVWLCTFPESEDGDGLYCSIVKKITLRVSNTLIARSLDNVESVDSGLAVGHVASVKCKAILQPLFRFADRFEFMSEEQGGSDNMLLPFGKSKESLMVRLKDHDGVMVEAEVKLVMMRLSLNRARFEREKRVYDILGSKALPGVLPLVQVYNMDRVERASETPEDASFARSLAEAGGNAPYDLKGYRYASVYPLGDRTLDDIIQREHGVDLRECMRQVLVRVKSLHERNVSMVTSN